MTMKNLTGLWPNLARAYEIAKLGDFTITVTYPKHDYIGVGDDYEKIKEYYGEDKFTDKGEMWIEINKPCNYDDGSIYESLDDIHKRVNAAINNPLPKRTEDSSEVLLKHAVQKLNFSMKDAKIIRRVAAVIGQLEGCKTIEAHCMAEAIHYRCNFNHEDELVIAESNTLKFGENIFIKQDGINFMYADEEKNIKKAIKYLKSLL